MKERPILFSGPMVRTILEGRKTQTRRVMKRQPPDDVAPITVSRYHPTIVDRRGEEAPGAEIFGASSDDGEWGCKSPFGEPGDRLWVRESHVQVFEVDIPAGRPTGPIGTMGSPAKPDWNSRFVYSADGPMPNVQWHHVGDSQPVRWTPSIHTPRAASRITLEITGVRVERLQSISEADAIAEGAVYTDFGIEPPTGSLSLDGGRTFHPVVRGTQRNGWHMGDATSHTRCMGSAKYAFANLINRLHGGENWNLKGPGLWEANPWVWVVEFRRVA
ncbi:hypothetical protein [Burkholderia sp. IMCC1007]|uniref:hypothetical protein n=1 Tax=Burkholderia sp. IMCC1007 TaxID=3004104 RepID=UPI003FA4429B